MRAGPGVAGRAGGDERLHALAGGVHERARRLLADRGDRALDGAGRGRGDERDASEAHVGPERRGAGQDPVGRRVVAERREQGAGARMGGAGILERHRGPHGERREREHLVGGGVGEPPRTEQDDRAERPLAVAHRCGGRELERRGALTDPRRAGRRRPRAGPTRRAR